MVINKASAMGENSELDFKGHSEDDKLENNEFADNDQPSESRSGQTADNIKGTINYKCARGLREKSSETWHYILSS